MKKTSLKEALRDLENYIRARYPLLYIVSSEEERLMRHLAVLAKRSGKRLFQWSATSGLEAADGGEAPVMSKTSRTPLGVLDDVLASSEKALFVLRDFHHYLEDPLPPYLDNPLLVRRKLRDAVGVLRRSYKTLILASPVLTLPADLAGDVTVLDFPLPDLAEIEQILDRLLAAVKQSSSRFEDLLDADHRERAIRGVLGLTEREAENVFSLAIVNDARFDASDIPLILDQKKQLIRRSGYLEYHEPDAAIRDIGGLEKLKEWLRRRSRAFGREAREFGLPEPKGVLLVGIQGCGKSLTAKAISSLWELPLLRLDVGALFGKYVGESEANLRKAIQTAETLAPVVLWVDELEKAFAGIGGGGEDGGVSTRIFGSFITWLQEKSSPVFVIATANRIQGLPPELLRKGRFDEIFFLDLPRDDERVEIFRIHVGRRRRDPAKFQLRELGLLAEGFSGAEIEQAVIAGLFEAFHAGRDLTHEDLKNAIQETVPLSVTMQEEIEALRQWCRLRARPAS